MRRGVATTRYIPLDLEKNGNTYKMCTVTFNKVLKWNFIKTSFVIFIYLNHSSFTVVLLVHTLKSMGLQW